LDPFFLEDLKPGEHVKPNRSNQIQAAHHWGPSPTSWRQVPVAEEVPSQKIKGLLGSLNGGRSIKK
jgi:hypothetical protein